MTAEPETRAFPWAAEVRHYAGYVALYIGHVMRYLLIGDYFNARRSAALAEGALELGASYWRDDLVA